MYTILRVVNFAFCSHLFVIFTNATAQVPLYPNPRTTVGNSPESGKLWDLDLDGDLDLVVGEHQTALIHILLNKGTGDWSAPIDLNAGSAGTTGLALLDLNGDSWTDIVASNFLSNKVAVRLGLGNVNFSPATTTIVGSAPGKVGVYDFDLDGNLDLVVGSNVPKGLTVLLGNGAGGFGVVIPYPGSETYRVTVADLNQDGRGDVAAAAPFLNAIEVYYGYTTGVLTTPVAIPVGTVPSDVVAIDATNDGVLDLVAGSNSANWVAIIPAATPGVFGLPAQIPAATAYSLNCEDIFQDGLPEILVSTEGVLFQMLIAGGGGSYPQLLKHAAGGSVRDCVPGDVNNDSLPDLVTVNAGANVTTTLQFPAGALPDARLAPSNGVAGVPPQSAHFADFNEDGFMDAVAVDTSGFLLFYAGDGQGNFLAATSTPTLGSPDALTIADVNLDHHLDVVVTGSNPGKYIIHSGNGGGALPGGMITNTGGLVPRDITTGDVNSDGRNDVLIANFSSGNMSLLLGLSSGIFSAAQLTATGGTQPSGVALGDPNQDGFDDAAVCNNSGTIGISMSNGHLLTAVKVYSPVSHPNCVLMGDFTGDGATDLAIGADVWTLSLYQNFLATAPTLTQTPSGGPLVSLASGDVDMSGTVDIVGGFNGTGFTVFLSSGGGVFLPQSFSSPVTSESIAVCDLDFDGRPEVVSAGTGAASMAISSRLLPVPSNAFPFGAGTPGCHASLGLAANMEPRVNQPNFRIAATNAPHAALGALVVSDALNPSGLDPFGMNILFYPDLVASTEVFIVDLESDSGGTASVAAPIPNNPSIANHVYNAQAIFAEPPGAQCSKGAAFLVTSRALILTIQP